ncbi:MAG: MAPEG family protein [Proteobacteria bacterium]|nr:MAPEG family protein [Pseudomonadota bacterium]
MDPRTVYFSEIITLLAVVLYYFVMGARVGMLRGRHGVKAPATTGHPAFERAYRIHCNTGEQLIAFFPALWLATILFHGQYWLPAAFGAIFLAGRVLYMQLYTADPEKRTAGAFTTMAGILGLIVLAAIGLVQNWGAMG